MHQMPTPYILRCLKVLATAILSVLLCTANSQSSNDLERLSQIKWRYNSSSNVSASDLKYLRRVAVATNEVHAGVALLILNIILPSGRVARSEILNYVVYRSRYHTRLNTVVCIGALCTTLHIKSFPQSRAVESLRVLPTSADKTLNPTEITLVVNAVRSNSTLERTAAAYVLMPKHGLPEDKARWCAQKLCELKSRADRHEAEFWTQVSRFFAKRNPVHL